MPLSVPARDGFALAAVLFEPSTPAPANAPIVVIASATATPQGFYARFASFLVENGVAAAITFDYRGVGGSMPPSKSLRGFVADINDWARLDTPGVTDFMRARFGTSRELVAVGHSVGGHMIMLHPDQEHVARSVQVTVGTAYYGSYTFPKSMRMAVMHYVLFPGLVALYDYLPSGDLNIAGLTNLPGGVGKQWSYWSRARSYFAREPENAAHARAWTGKSMLLSFTDDNSIDARHTSDMLEFVPNGQVEWIYLDPADLGLSKVDHMGFFFKAMREALWKPVLKYILTGEIPPELATKNRRLSKPPLRAKL
nr:hypothetical protein HK105_008305 [Polyrhizophydium stewartii]